MSSTPCSVEFATFSAKCALSLLLQTTRKERKSGGRFRHISFSGACMSHCKYLPRSDVLKKCALSPSSRTMRKEESRTIRDTTLSGACMSHREYSSSRHSTASACCETTLTSSSQLILLCYNPCIRKSIGSPFSNVHANATATTHLRSTRHKLRKACSQGIH